MDCLLGMDTTIIKEQINKLGKLWIKFRKHW